MTDRTTYLTSESELTSDFERDVLRGLDADSKSIPSKYLYDARGSELFDQICDLPEYYVTRTELKLIKQHGEEMASEIGEGASLIELGSGSGAKTERLLEACDLQRYVPVDIAQDFLLESSARIQTKFPELNIEPIWSDFTSGPILPDQGDDDERRVVFFSGSTIGNFTETEAARLLEQIADVCGTSGGLLIGIDLQKDIQLLEAAYNDKQGVTAKFTCNLLRRMQEELDAELTTEQFDHLAYYNTDKHRIEIYLESLVEQEIAIGDRSISLEAGERIRTEFSHKFRIDSFAELASKYGFELKQQWTDENRLFAVLFFEKG